MLAFVEQLQEVNVEGVEPMTSVTPMAMKKRADVVTDGGIAEDIVKNAPASEDQFFPGAEGGGIMCIACELSFWNMIDALPPEDQSGSCASRPRALPAIQPTARAGAAARRRAQTCG